MKQPKELARHIVESLCGCWMAWMPMCCDSMEAYVLWQHGCLCVVTAWMPMYCDSMDAYVLWQHGCRMLVTQMQGEWIGTQLNLLPNANSSFLSQNCNNYLDNKV